MYCDLRKDRLQKEYYLHMFTLRIEKTDLLDTNIKIKQKKYGGVRRLGDSVFNALAENPQYLQYHGLQHALLTPWVPALIW